MSKYQYYSSLDPLSSYKKDKSQIYRNCDFYENLENGSETTLRSGSIGESKVLEKITTDGHISIDGISKESSFIISRNELFRLSNSKSLNITITDASFFVSTISIDGKKMHNIHTIAGSVTLYDRILDYLYNSNNSFKELETIEFKEPAVVRYITSSSTELYDLKTGQTKRKK